MYKTIVFVLYRKYARSSIDILSIRGNVERGSSSREGVTVPENRAWSSETPHEFFRVHLDVLLINSNRANV